MWSLIASLLKHPDSHLAGWLNVISRRYIDGTFSVLKQYQDADIRLDQNFFILADAAVSVVCLLLSQFAMTLTKVTVEVVQCQHHLISLIEGILGVCDVLSISFRSLALVEKQDHLEGQLLLNITCLNSIQLGINVFGPLSCRQELSSCSYLFKNNAKIF